MLALTESTMHARVTIPSSRGDVPGQPKLPGSLGSRLNTGVIFDRSDG